MTCTSPILHACGACGCEVDYAELGPFDVVSADPPWAPDDALGARGAEANYNVMSVDDLCRLVLPRVADDALLFLWRLSSMVEEAYRVVRAWGFTPKTEIVWRKTTKLGKRHFGMGHYVRAEHETCVVAARGKNITAVHDVRSCLDAEEPPPTCTCDGMFANDHPGHRPHCLFVRFMRGDLDASIFEARATIHSRKPPEARAIFERLGGSAARRVELFAREDAPGWTCLGNEVPNKPTTLRVRTA